MKHAQVAGLLAIALAACQPQGLKLADVPAAPSPPSAPAGCDARHAGSWSAGGQTYALAADVSGPDCERAAVLLTARDAGGDLMLVWAGATRDIFGLYDVTDPAAMPAALAEWIDQPPGADTSRLPDWTEADAAADVLPGGEFPFHPEAWVDRSEYLAIRAEAAPMLTFPQGHESMAVFALRDGYLMSIGIHQFPG